MLYQVGVQVVDRFLEIGGDQVIQPLMLSLTFRVKLEYAILQIYSKDAAGQSVEIASM